MHPLDPLLDAAGELKGEPVRFLFVGEGVRKAQLMARAQREGLEQVTFLPYQPEERFAKLVGAADACFVVLEPGLERLAFPSRAFTFLSAACPLITLMAPEAELVRLIEKTGSGWNVTTAQELVELIRRLLSHPEELVRKRAAARKAYERDFLRERILDRYAEVLQALKPS
jgi:glycosyltransferase involved in cell wall biosynthesis